MYSFLPQSVRGCTGRHFVPLLTQNNHGQVHVSEIRNSFAFIFPLVFVKLNYIQRGTLLPIEQSGVQPHPAPERNLSDLGQEDYLNQQSQDCN